ncbi:tetratricopeptide repeat protein [bacterium]|nr:tetratricopeptide repeat protein [bacterium]
MEKTAGLTVCMIVRDECENLERVLPAVVGNADDIVVVDTGSTDGTPDVVRRFGARLFERPWDDDFAAARNHGLEEVRTSHVLWLDADDRIDGEGLRQVREKIRETPDRGLLLLLVNSSGDASTVSSCWQLRVFPSRPEHRFTGRIHEQVQESLNRTGTKTDRLDVTITHTGYQRSEDVLRKSRRNLEMLRREINEGKDDINVLYHFVKAASRCGELDEAARVSRRCVENAPPGTPEEIIQAVALQWSRLELQRGNHDAAREVLDGAIERRPDDPLARFFLGDLFRRQGDLHSALRELEAARAAPIRTGMLPLPVAGLFLAIRVQLGEVREVLGDAKGAVAVYREAHGEHPEDQGIVRALARALVGCGATAEARAVLRTAKETPANRSELLLLKASIAFNDGDDDEAEELFARVEKETPRMWAAPLHLGHLKLRNGAVREALANYRRAVSAADTPETRVGLAAAQLEDGQLVECLDNLAAAVDQCATRPLPPGTEALSGEALLRFGRPAEAQGAFERHLRRHGPDARILSRLADCYREVGADAAARMGYQEALKLAPDLAEARNGLESLQTVQ